MFKKKAQKMYHDERSLLKIEKWARGLSWYFAAAVVIGLLARGYDSISAWIDPALPYWAVNDPTWYKVWVPVSGLYQLSTVVLFWLLLMGIAKTIRFLLALKARVMPGDAATSEI